MQEAKRRVWQSIDFLRDHASDSSTIALLTSGKSRARSAGAHTASAGVQIIGHVETHGEPLFHAIVDGDTKVSLRSELVRRIARDLATIG